MLFFLHQYFEQQNYKISKLLFLNIQVYSKSYLQFYSNYFEVPLPCFPIQFELQHLHLVIVNPPKNKCLSSVLDKKVLFLLSSPFKFHFCASHLHLKPIKFWIRDRFCSSYILRCQLVF